MASLPLNIIPTAPAGSAAGGEGRPAVQGGVSGADKDNQGNSISFPQLIKQMAPEVKKPRAEELLAAQAAASQDQDAAPPLPPPGTVLPSMLPPSLTPAAGDTAAAADTGREPGKGQGGAVLAALSQVLNVQRGHDKAAALPATAQPADAKGDQDLAARLGADAAARFIVPSQAAVQGTPAGEQAAQALLKDMNALLANRHGGTLEAARGVEGVNTNQGAGALLQAGDKLPAAAPAQAAIAVPVRHPEWGDELGSRINWMIRQDVQSASVKLNPPHLGPLEVKVSMVNDQVNVSFTTHHAPVRDALDASLSRLRELLSDNGLQLGDANVSHRSYSDQQQSGQQAGDYRGGMGDDAAAAPEDDLLAPVHQPLYYLGDRSVDIYA